MFETEYVLCMENTNFCCWRRATFIYHRTWDFFFSDDRTFKLKSLYDQSHHNRGKQYV